uniref:WASH complex subunit CCDC53 n=1 Tax=Photinus pyralis TaxID=7054 RepID=A0A1Y1KM04_PHOPY
MEVSDFATIDPNCDYEKISPILQKRIVVFVNHFLSSTVSFLNTFAQSCESRLMEFEYKIQKIEASLLILESQLSSISVLNKVADNETKASEVELLELPEVSEEKNETVDNSNHVKAADDPRYQKFFKMLQFGVPLQAVKNKMAVEGFDPDLLDNPNANVRNDSVED